MDVMAWVEMREKVVEVRRASNRVMTVAVVFEEDVLRLICGYASQSGRSLEEKQSFYDKLNVSGICIAHVIYLRALAHGHVGRRIDGFDWVHGGYDVG